MCHPKLSVNIMMMMIFAVIIWKLHNFQTGKEQRLLLLYVACVPKTLILMMMIFAIIIWKLHNFQTGKEQRLLLLYVACVPKTLILNSPSE